MSGDTIGPYQVFVYGTAGIRISGAPYTSLRRSILDQAKRCVYIIVDGCISECPEGGFHCIITSKVTDDHG